MSGTEILNHERNGKVLVAVQPSKLHDHIRRDVGEARIQGRTEAFLLGRLAKESEQALDDLAVSGFVGRVDAVLPHAIVLGKLNGLGPLLVATVDVGRNTTEFQELMRRQF